jgi:Rrf2 family protein
MLALPRTAEYALQAVSYIAEHEAAGPVPVSEIAAALGAPRNYLSKILNELGAQGVLQASRGVRGGYRLGLPPDACRLSAIVEPFLSERGHRCIMGRTRCSPEAPCGAHHLWMDIRERARVFFMELTMADLLHPASAASAPSGRVTDRSSTFPA